MCIFVKMKYLSGYWKCTSKVLVRVLAKKTVLFNSGKSDEELIQISENMDLSMTNCTILQSVQKHF